LYYGRQPCAVISVNACNTPHQTMHAANSLCQSKGKDNVTHIQPHSLQSIPMQSHLLSL
jgi:hypothetical protein